jgi:hypothetical protein
MMTCGGATSPGADPRFVADSGREVPAVTAESMRE